jgi:hypothetical protein
MGLDPGLVDLGSCGPVPAAGPSWPMVPGPGPRVECRQRFPGGMARGQGFAGNGPRSLAAQALARFLANNYWSKLN